MPFARVNVNPDVLRWAVDYSQKGVQAFQNKFPKFNNWLDQSARPTVKQLEDVARFAYVPFGYLMLPEKPILSIRPIKDFRAVNNAHPDAAEEYSPELLDTVIDIRGRQEWLSEYKKRQDYAPVPFVGSINTQMADEAIVAKIKKTLNCRDNWREQIPNKDAALRFFVDMVERTGVVVFINSVVGNNSHRKLNVREFRGFALADKFAPVIFINGADALSARIFTLFHELVHIFLGQDGLDDRSEVFCNRIAARFLVPEKLFDVEWVKNAHDYEAMERFFKVSKLVLYRAALTYGKISDEEYQRLVNLYEKNAKKIDMNSNGGNPYNFLPYRASRSFCRYLREAVSEGHATYTEAYQLLGVKKAKTFDFLINKATEG